MAQARTLAPSWGYLGISYQHKPSTIPSSLGNIVDSATSEAVGKELNKKETKK